MENNELIRNLMDKFLGAPAEKTAFSLYDGRQVTDISYNQFGADILKTAGFFRKNGISGQHIALAGPNSYDWVVTFFAAVFSGNAVILLNPDLPGTLLEEQCSFADASLVFTEPERAAEMADSTCVRWMAFDSIRHEAPAEADQAYPWKMEDTMAMMFTSGTTGKSKAVEFSFGNIQAFLDGLEGVLDPDYDRVLLVAPVHHIMGLATVLSRVERYHEICIGRGIRYMIPDMPILNPRYLQMVPTILESLVKLLKKAKTPEQRQKYIGKNLAHISVGGAMVNQEHCRFMMDLGIAVEAGYGMTETTGTGTRCIWDANTMGSIGKPYGKTILQIRDGELLMKGPAVMKGYYKDPEETAKVIEDGWIHTGDMVHCDENGYYYITGRKKNVIILSSGENVNPEEIEARFGKCPQILECLVYSDGKGICADVYTRDEPACAAYIKAYNESMPMYRHVYKVHYMVQPLEKTASGKIKRKENT